MGPDDAFVRPDRRVDDPHQPPPGDMRSATVVAADVSAGKRIPPH
jgi:hypothetical protein